MRLEYAAGERMFVDFAGDTVPVTDPETGEIWNAQVFVSVLGASGYLYVEATRSQDLASWLGAHVRALEFYGGVATRGRARQPEVGRDQSVLVRARAERQLPGVGAHVLAWRFCPPGRIGRGIRPPPKLACRSPNAGFWRPLRKRQFFSLAELNAAIAEQLALVNDRRFRGQAISRRDLFEELERAALQPLPTTRYEFATWKPAQSQHRLSRRVRRRATTRCRTSWHAKRSRCAPPPTSSRSSIVADGWPAMCAATVDSGSSPCASTCPPRTARIWSGRRPSWWRGARRIGPSVAELMETILRTRPHPEHGYRACLGLMHLVKRYERERMLAACQRALADWQHLVPQRQRHLEERPRQGARCRSRRLAGEDRADPARQPARRGLLPAELDGGLSHAADTRPSTSSTRWACSAWCSGCASNSNRTST